MTLIENLRIMVTSIDTKLGRRFTIFIQVLIIISLLTFSIETIPGLTPPVKTALHIFEIICISIFSIEYILRIYFSKNTFSYIFSFYGIIDLLAILPFYLAMGIDLRSIRVFRVFRLFRVFKLIRYNSALSRFKHSAIESKEEIILFLILTGMLLYLSAVGIYFFENEAQPDKFSSVFHSLWWAISTLTTVGYGDIYPVTLGGKIFTFFILIIGLGIVTVPAGIVAAALTKATKK